MAVFYAAYAALLHCSGHQSASVTWRFGGRNVNICGSAALSYVIHEKEYWGTAIGFSEYVQNGRHYELYFAPALWMQNVSQVDVGMYTNGVGAGGQATALLLR